MGLAARPARGQASEGAIAAGFCGPTGHKRLMRVLTLPFNAAFSRQISTGIFMDTADMTFDPTATLKLFPMELAHFEDGVRSRYGSGVAV